MNLHMCDPCGNSAYDGVSKLYMKHSKRIAFKTNYKAGACCFEFGLHLNIFH